MSVSLKPSLPLARSRGYLLDPRSSLLCIIISLKRNKSYFSSVANVYLQFQIINVPGLREHPSLRYLALPIMTGSVSSFSMTDAPTLRSLQKAV
jgi:hypothetical protein